MEDRSINSTGCWFSHPESKRNRQTGPKKRGKETFVSSNGVTHVYRWFWLREIENAHRRIIKHTSRGQGVYTQRVATEKRGVGNSRRGGAPQNGRRTAHTQPAEPPRQQRGKTAEQRQKRGAKAGGRWERGTPQHAHEAFGGRLLGVGAKTGGMGLRKESGAWWVGIFQSKLRDDQRDENT